MHTSRCVNGTAHDVLRDSAAVRKRKRAVLPPLNGGQVKPISLDELAQLLARLLGELHGDFPGDAKS